MQKLVKEERGKAQVASGILRCTLLNGKAVYFSAHCGQSNRELPPGPIMTSAFRPGTTDRKD
jgi:hypothetical protein